jgi:hypothetical protein
MNGPKQTPDRRCGFCGEGVVCEHGYCVVCQPCVDCMMDELELAKLANSKPDGG